jgi:hypothetical protein
MMEKIMTAERVKTDKKFGRLRIAAKRTLRSTMAKRT